VFGLIFLFSNIVFCLRVMILFYPYWAVVTFHELSRSLHTKLPANNMMLGNSTAFDALYEIMISKMEYTFPVIEDQKNDVEQIKGIFMELSGMKLDMGTCVY
jgi:hypothetical protein